MKEILLIFITSAIPVVEQRGAIPVGILAYGLDPFLVFWVSLLGSLLPFPFIYFFIRPIFNYIKQKTRFGKWVDRIEKSALSKSAKVQQYETWGLMLFVGVPLPGTGIWTGSLIAALLNLRFKYAFIAILGGAIISAVLLTLGMTGIIAIF